MNARALFIGADGRPYPAWRLLLFLLVFAVCGLVVTIALHPLLRGIDLLTGIAGIEEAYLTLLALILAHWITWKTFDRRSWSFVWLGPEAARPSRFAIGAALGGLPIGLVTLLLWSVGLLVLMPSPDGPWITVALQTIVLLLPAALGEELLSRGYLFATMREWLGARWAVAVTSLAFGLLHLANPNVSGLSIVLVTLAGVYLAVVLLATRSMYAAWMAHFAWNWVMAGLLHVPVSGLSMARPDYQIVDAGPDWITGGAWGPEGGVGAAIGMLGGLGFLFWRSRRAPTAESNQQINDYN